MQGSTIRRAARTLVGCAAAAAAIGGAAGCGDDDEESAKPTAFAIEATAQGKQLAMTFPATVEAGLVTMTLTNSDKRPRSANIVRMGERYSVDDVLKIINADDSKIPAWIQDGGGISTVAPGQTTSVTQNLAPGKYAIWDDEGEEDGPGNDELGAKGEFTVTGEAKDDELPSVPGTLTATDEGDKDYGFTFKGLKAGTNRVRFENTGEQLHHALLFPYAKGKTFADVEKAAKQGFEGGPPPLDFEGGIGTSVIDGGIAQNIELELKPGKYAVLCFIPDRDGGKPHAAKGMLDELVVE